MLQTRQHVFRIGSKCPKMSQNVHFIRIVVRTDLFVLCLPPSFPGFEVTSIFTNLGLCLLRPERPPPLVAAVAYW